MSIVRYTSLPDLDTLIERLGSPMLIVESRIFCDRLNDEFRLMFRLEKRVLHDTEKYNRM